MSGVVVANLSPRFNEEVGLDPLLNGVIVVDVERRSFAARRGLRRGYRILSLNGRDVTSTADLERRLATAQRWDLEVDVGGRVVGWCTTERGRRC
ncbi:MAG: PDZ domain-containing protein [Parvularculaceae bacterium]